MSDPLTDLSPSALSLMSDADFQESVKTHARGKSAEAIAAIEDVMHNSDDDNARLVAASKVLHMAKVEDEKSTALPIGVSEEVMKIALAGLAQAALLASNSGSSAVLRDVTPAKADPRKFIADDSPLNSPMLSEPKEVTNEEDLQDIITSLEE